MKNNRRVIKDSTITTGSISHGLLNPEQAEKFIQQTFEATPLGSLVRHEMRRSKTGEIDKIGIGRRILRKKIENTDDNYRAGVKTDSVEYSTVAVRLPWEITGETQRENIEGPKFDKTVTDLMTRQLGVDREDLFLNGDENVSPDDPDYDFLKINTGWVKQIENNGHVYDAQGGTGDGSMCLDMFYKALQQIPNKYNNGNLRWIMSPFRAQNWELSLLNKVIEKGGAVPDSVYKSPASIPHIVCPSLSDDKILLCDPKNLIAVDTYDVIIRKTNEGKDAIMKDKIFYVIHFDLDAIIEEADATAIITNIK